ncbi:unnamed protein product [Bursaphelenchus okinawaensis]|uniref:Uncharacterized protein n=1 Tax=Bursaphelenchus okinawaensis TaxID=465554 RepID=A0A811JRC2_9BILA|nr:unnamed protein product [Bursaphelenchus okinawaensis]CAG9079585.1 unnamed protein product [Bursaphelenchus okinawaensis]
MADSRTLTVVLVVLYGILKEFRPSTPFLTPFLEGPDKNLTNEELYGQVYPYWTYSYLVFLIPIFIITDLLKYKPVVVIEAAALTTTWALLVFGNTVWQMQIMQIAFGLATSAEIAYYSYLYAVVDKRNFKKVTAYIRSAVMLGKFFGYTVAQTIVSLEIGSYLLLNQITLGSVTVTLIISLFLQFHKTPDNTRIADSVHPNDADFHEARTQNTVPRISTNLISELLEAFRDPTVLSWSIWWALASCGMFQVQNYSQSLWAPMQKDGQFMGNGLMECVTTLSSTLLTFGLQYTSFDFKKHSSTVFLSTSIFSAILLAGMASIQIIWFSYFFYIFNLTLYHVLIAAASNTIAAQLHSSKYSLIFGFNTFVALILQTGLTFTVADKRGLHLPIVTQFYVYSGYFAILALLFVPFAVFGKRLVDNEKGDDSELKEEEVSSTRC